MWPSDITNIRHNYASVSSRLGRVVLGCLFGGTHTPGISALQIQRQLGIGGYKNAWHLLHRLRKGMVRDSRTKLSGLVEVDESFVGGNCKR